MKNEYNSNEIKKLIDSLDYEKIRSFMILSNWKYRDNTGNRYTPSIENLKETAKKCVMNVYNSYVNTHNEYAYASCGGFKAEYTPLTNFITLSFVIQKKYYSTNSKKFLW